MCARLGPATHGDTICLCRSRYLEPSTPRPAYVYIGASESDGIATVRQRESQPKRRQKHIWSTNSPTPHCEAGRGQNLDFSEASDLRAQASQRSQCKTAAALRQPPSGGRADCGAVVAHHVAGVPQHVGAKCQRILQNEALRIPATNRALWSSPKMPKPRQRRFRKPPCQSIGWRELLLDASVALRGWASCPATSGKDRHRELPTARGRGAAPLAWRANAGACHATVLGPFLFRDGGWEQWTRLAAGETSTDGRWPVKWGGQGHCELMISFRLA